MTQIVLVLCDCGDAVGVVMWVVCCVGGCDGGCCDRGVCDGAAYMALTVPL